MKTEDYEKLKQLCDANGFELLTESPKENDKFFVVKKNIWEGVEFIECINSSVADSFINGNIYKIQSNENSMIRAICEKGYTDSYHISNFKPSTESAYIEQLKRIAFEKFGEIKEGDRFDFSIINSEWSKKGKIYGNIFEYDKDLDRLTIGSKSIITAIYQQGKWAEKLPERVKVDFSWTLLSDVNRVYYHFYYNVYTTKTGQPIVNDSERNKIQEIGKFLSQQLENYLNDTNNNQD